MTDISEFLLARILENDAGADPRVLAEGLALRAVIRLHRSEAEMCSLCTFDANSYTGERYLYPCLTLIALARPYVDHPDFDQRWSWSRPRLRAARHG